MERKKKSYAITNESLVRRKYMSYKALQQTVQDIKIRNKWQYEKWIDREKPLSIPKYPWRVYKEWTTWGDFLGTDSEFVPFMKWKEMQRKEWRTYWEAARWVQQRGYKSGREFQEACERGEVPSDIPKAPQQVYSEKYKGGWQGWSAFLGKNIQHKVETMQKITKLFAIASVAGHPSNYVRVIVADQGVEQMMNLIDVNAFRIYEYENDNDLNVVNQIMNETSSKQAEGIFLCSNLNSLFFELDSEFKFRKDIGDRITEEVGKKATSFQ